MNLAFKVLVACACLVSAVASAAYPDRQITIVVPYNAGGGADPIARKVAIGLQKKFNANVIVENRAGASGTIGAAWVAKASADGYTLLFDATPFSINPHLYSKLPYSQADFSPVTGLLLAPQMVLVPPDSSVRSVKDLADKARAEPGKVTYGSGGSGTVQRLSAELLRQGLNLDMLHVPYKSGTDVVNGLMGHQTDWIVAGMVANYTLVKAGKFRAIAVTSAQRSKLLPDVPTVSESGIPGYETYEWNGLLAPAKTPPDVILKLQDAVIEILNSDEMRSYLTERGVIPVGSTSAQFGEFLRKESAKWAEVIRKGDIRAD